MVDLCHYSVSVASFRHWVSLQYDHDYVLKYINIIFPTFLTVQDADSMSCQYTTAIAFASVMSVVLAVCVVVFTAACDYCPHQKQKACST